MKGVSQEGMIGLEIHVYPRTKGKLFCSCAVARPQSSKNFGGDQEPKHGAGFLTEKGARKNSAICPVCTGQPGSKPGLPTREAVEQAVKVALMLQCKIGAPVGNNPSPLPKQVRQALAAPGGSQLRTSAQLSQLRPGGRSDAAVIQWQRKHYSWPDLPKGYQLTLSGSGAVPIGVEGSFMGIGITQVHLEEDPAAWDPETGCVDYNRSGVPLLEIVTEPEFSTAEEVQAWLAALVHGLRYLGAIDPDAGLKADVNVSIPGKHDRVEVKNVHSVKEIGAAIEYELERQGKEGLAGLKKPSTALQSQLSVGETRRFDAASGKTAVMRSKEGADDYRFLVDPDLLGLNLSKDFVRGLEKGMPETPEEKLKKLVGKYKLGKQDAAVLAKHLEVVEFYEGVVSSGLKPGFVLPWVTGELLRVLHYSGHELGAVDIKVEHFAALLRLVKEGKITDTQAKKILNDFVPKSFDPAKNVKEKVSDAGALGKIVTAVLKANGKAVSDYASGNKGALHFLVGQVMAKTKGAADVGVVRLLLEKTLK